MTPEVDATTGTGSTLLVSTRAELEAHLAPHRRAGRTVALVPTMGALHEGHASLVAEARRRAGAGPVVVTVFVNPLQFAPGEDLDRYPRTLEADLAVCAREGADLVLAPPVEEVYPSGAGPDQVAGMVSVAPGPLATVLEGRTRPTHFAGVLTVVAKLFGLVRPDVACFGEKDYQQLVLVRRMVADLCLGVDVVGVPTVRDPDGLALSSRNAYLDPEQREAALALQRTVVAVAAACAAEGVDAGLRAGRAELRASPGVDLDYLELTGPDLEPLGADVAPGTPARVLIAARVGATRLIDNLATTVGVAPAVPGGRTVTPR